MGLGKTMQTLAYLGSLMRARTISNAIVVCPKSVVQNWEREANLILKNMCVPRATVYAVTSDISKERRVRIFTDSFCSSVNAPRLVVTTYGLVSNHISDLNSIANAHQEFRWCYVILDEGHLIKNSKTKTSRDVRILAHNKKTRRLLLTGTPIQNNMRELHTLFDWATSSKLLGSMKTFLNRYGHPIEEGRQRNASEWTVKKAAEMNTELQKLLQPYFLQRLKKTEFEGTLPGKKELVVFTRLSAKQRRMYADFTERVLFDGEMLTSPLAAVSWLKMLCGHPSLVKEASRNIDCDADLLLKDSAKLQVLILLLCRLKRSGHRTLVFSQSTKMLDIMERVCDHSSLSYLRIDGSSTGKSRQKAVDHFNDIDSGIDAMLLSTKAAGIGLTLTGKMM
jgi:SNF2 family DNA or RNA helicase